MEISETMTIMAQFDFSLFEKVNALCIYKATLRVF